MILKIVVLLFALQKFTILYNYRRHPFQNTADQKQLKKNNSVVKNNLLKFGIKIDKN